MSKDAGAPPEKARRNGAATPGLATKGVRAGLARSSHGETSEALYLTSGHVYDSAEEAAARFSGDAPGYIYARYGNPTVAMFEARLAALEGAESCMAAASGMAAMFGALAAHLSAGDHIVASRYLFGSCHQVITRILPRFGIGFTLVDAADMAAWEAAVTPQTKAFFLETPANPTLDIFDIAAIARIAHEAGALLFVDNVFATPILQNPLALGADVVIHSATKHMDGQGRALGGAALAGEAFIHDTLRPFVRNTGPALSPFNAWLMLKGLETLKLRVEAASRSARAIAGHLEARLGPGRVRYPHLKSFPAHDLAKRQMRMGGTLTAFELPGGRGQAFAFLNALRLIDISNNLGDAKSLITHPASTTHHAVDAEDRAAQGVSEGLVRLSVGLEDTADLLADLDQALEQAGA